MTEFLKMAPSKRLLVADDSLTIQKVIRLALSNEGYEIQTLADGKDALEQISVFRPAAVLIDVALPTKSAFELKREINHLPDLNKIKFILMSSAFEKVDEDQVKEVGFSGRLTKPFDPAHLRQVIQSVLENTTPTAAEKTRLPTPPPTSAKVDSSKIHSDTTFDLPPLPQFAPFSQQLPQTPQPISASSNTFDLPPLGSEFPPFPMDSTNPGTLPTLPFSEKPEDDIKKLTESTIKMSGLDEFQWSVQEPAHKTGAPPPPSHSATVSSPSAHAELPPLPQSVHVGGFQFDQFEKEEPTARIQAPPMAGTAASGVSVSPEHIQNLVKTEVHRVLESTIQKILPDLAERILKEEIHRLLSE